MYVLLVGFFVDWFFFGVVLFGQRCELLWSFVVLYVLKNINILIINDVL